MRSCSKYLLLSSFLFIMGIPAVAQELTAEIANNIKYGRTEKLEKYTAADNINACMGVRNSKKYNYLAISIKLKSLKSLKFFVENGADIEGVCADKTPLMYAAKYGQLEQFKYLVDQGAELDASVKGHKALSIARRYNRSDIVKYIKNIKSQ